MSNNYIINMGINLIGSLLVVSIRINIKTLFRLKYFIFNLPSMRKHITNVRFHLDSPPQLLLN